MLGPDVVFEVVFSRVDVEADGALEGLGVVPVGVVPLVAHTLPTQAARIKHRREPVKQAIVA